MVKISNFQIIELLKGKERRTYVEMAKELNVSETAIRKRISNLEKSGIIKEYNVEVDNKKLGYDIRALIGVDTEPENFIDILEMLKKDENVKTLYISSGDHMLVFEMWFKNSDDLRYFVKELEKTKGIKKICPSIIQEKIK